MDPLTSRRHFLQAVGLAVPATALFGCSKPLEQADLVAANMPGPQFLTAQELHFIDAAMEQLIPDDADHPGAKGAGVTTFIDRQLSGPYGMAETWYMQGPWQKGTKQQGYQSKLNPAQLYRTAIRDIQAHCQRKYNKPFEQLPSATRDEVLHGLENGDIELPDAPSKEFFTMLWNNTQQGYLADPMYGGNRDFAGWKLVGFPGPRYNYVDDIEQFGKPYTLPTVGLKGRGDLDRDGG